MNFPFTFSKISITLNNIFDPPLIGVVVIRGQWVELEASEVGEEEEEGFTAEQQSKVPGGPLPLIGGQTCKVSPITIMFCFTVADLSCRLAKDERNSIKKKNTGFFSK